MATDDGKWFMLVALGLFGFTVFSGFMLASSTVFADHVIDRTNIAIPVSCTMSGMGMDSHNAEINNGQSNSAIGETTLKVFCNDDNGFAIYAIGYTDGEEGNNVLANLNLGSAYDIVTGIATSGNVSNWAMKLSVATSPIPTYPIAIQNSFDSFHDVPDEYAMVAKRTSGSDAGAFAEGSVLKTTYQAYVSPTQPAGVYIGQVKYTLVHPNDNPIPDSTMLDTGQVVGAKMKTLAAGGTSKAYNDVTTDIKAIRMADSLPSGFVASDANTVSVDTVSRHPIYIFFDNTNDAGIMYFYSGDHQIVMNPDSSHLFRSNPALADISGLATWDSSEVTSMRYIFTDSVASLTNVDALSSWNTSNVEDMTGAFLLRADLVQAGYTSSLNDISGLINWNTGNVTSMYMMFRKAFQLTSLHGLEFWDVSKVEDMRLMFAETVSLADLSPLASWNTRSVTTMEYMFAMDVGDSKIGDPVIDLEPLANWNVSGVLSMRAMFQNINIASFLPLKNWNVGKVKDFVSTFDQTNKSTTTTLAGLESWNVSSATNMSSMFADSVSLVDASAINGWDVSGVVDASSNESNAKGFNKMFLNSPAHPVFTLRIGTWNGNGTFIPSS